MLENDPCKFAASLRFISSSSWMDLINQGGREGGRENWLLGYDIHTHTHTRTHPQTNTDTRTSEVVWWS